MSAPKPQDIEDILLHHYPLKQLADALAQSLAPMAAAKGHGETSGIAATAFPDLAKVDALRQELLALPANEVARRAAVARAARAAAVTAGQVERLKIKKAKAEAKERARFYNQPPAMADFGFWAKAESWTVDDAVALLLGRDPRVVTRDALRIELASGTGLMQLGDPLPRSVFHDACDDLRLLIERSDALTASRLNPGDVVAWAQRTGAANVPPGLLAMLPPAPPQTATPATPPALAGNPAGSAVVREKGSKWNPDELAALRAFKALHGTLAAAVEFNISVARVRKLAPSEPERSAPAPSLKSWVHRSR